MYKNILVPTDGSALSLKAARTAAKLARALNARITTLYVIAPFTAPMVAEGAVYHMPYSLEEYERVMKKTADAALAKVAAAAGRVKCETIVVTDPNPWQAIIKATRTKKCDLVVMASHGRRGLAGLLLGSETQKVLTHSKTPVLVCR